MARFRLTRIASPGLLASITRERLLRFLEPMQQLLVEKGFGWPDPGSAAIDYDKLAEILHFPLEPPPEAMIESLLLVEEMSDVRQMDRILDALRERGLDLGLGGNVSAADVAVETCLQAKPVLAALHAENRTLRARNFRYFSGMNGRPGKFPKFDDATLTALAAELDITFVERNRDDGSQVFVFPRGREVWIMVRRGGTLQRHEAKGQDGKPKVGVVRPLEYDVLLYDRETDEIGLNIQTKWQEKLYLPAIGKHLFNDESYFPHQCALTFQPLIDRGPEALFCQDIPGLEAVKLVEAVRVSNDALSTIDIKKSSDVFGSLNESWRAFFKFGRIVRVVFNMWFQGEKKPRTVTMAAPNVTKYERDSDGMLVLEWMVERGFKSGPQAMRDAAE
jgi:hypothetical protein